MLTRLPGSTGSARHRVADGEGLIMGLFRRTPTPEQVSRKAARHQKPTRRERRAAERTARAEAALVQTEQRIHQIADEVRDDLKRSA
jgi:hypothetical protein